MKLTSLSFGNNKPIPSVHAFCAQAPQTHVTLSKNVNPAFSWSDLPAGTKSLVLICHDRDVPSKADDVNKEGRTIHADLPRIDFYHWVLVDLSPAAGGIEQGEYSSSVTARGKSGPAARGNTRQGLNDYTKWFAGDKDMGGKYFGYDGPCPPWNDSVVHHYVFTLYALDVARCPVEGEFTGDDVRQAIAGRVLAQASVTGTYSLNPKLSA